MANGGADVGDLGVDDIDQTDDESAGRYSQEELFGDMADEYDSLDNFRDDLADSTEELEAVQDRLQEKSEEAYQKTRESMDLMEELQEVGDGDVAESYEGVKGWARQKISGVPVVGEKLADVGGKPSLTTQLQMRYNVLQRHHEQIGESAEKIEEKTKEWEQKRDEFGDAYSEKLQALNEAEEELVQLQDQYDELETEVERLEELRETVANEDEELSEEQVELAQEYDLEPEDGLRDTEVMMAKDNVDKKLNELDNQIRETQKKVEKNSLAAARLDNMQDTADTMISAMDEVRETADEIYRDMDDSMDQLDHVIGQVVEELAETTTLYEDTKELTNESIEMMMEGAREVKRARVGVFGEEIIEEDTRENVEETLAEMEEIDKKNMVEARQSVREDQEYGE
ncbi:MAG: hypothetical protein SVU32_05565 [Candidatus Nanohaloarchaea archaeon]|nr:hypothetical protein [Candidatus Nanohaloarchaea archaeon]